MSGTHVAAGAGLTPLIAQSLQYFSTWPLAPLDGQTSMAIAGLIVAVVGGGGLAWFGGVSPSTKEQDAKMFPIVPDSRLPREVEAAAERDMAKYAAGDPKNPYNKQ